MPRQATIPTKIIDDVTRCPLSSSQTEREFRRLLAGGAKVVCAGAALGDLDQLWNARLWPKHKIELFATTFYLTNVRQIPELRFYVAYVCQRASSRSRVKIHPRIFYKDLSLVWRSASHYSREDDAIWMGKGDVRREDDGIWEYEYSNEATTDLPLEMQNALENLLGHTRRPLADFRSLELILRRARPDRIEPFADFVRPREIAASNQRNLINDGQPVAWFARAGDPESLQIATGYAPDFRRGILSKSTSHSKLYGGQLRRFRIQSLNQKIQYSFIAGPRHVWIIPPQAFTTQLSSYGVRTIDVNADDDLFIPGYEYHHWEVTADGGKRLYSQIPAGFAGDTCPVDDAKADASPWLDKIPLIQDFRSSVLKQASYP